MPGQVVRRHRPNPLLLPQTHRLGAVTEDPGLPGLHFHEHHGQPVAGDDVDFSQAGPVAPRKNDVPTVYQRLAREVFSKDSERLPAICGHAHGREQAPFPRFSARRYFRFQRVPVGLSSSTMPRASRS